MHHGADSAKWLIENLEVQKERLMEIFLKGVASMHFSLVTMDPVM